MMNRSTARSSAQNGGKKSSAYYMQRMRKHLVDAGYVKHETYVLPENRALLKEVEKRLRQPLINEQFKLESCMTEYANWKVEGLHQALRELDEAKRGDMAVSLVLGVDPSIKVEMNEIGGLPVFIAVIGEQIIIDTVLVDQDSITDPVAFNDTVLRSRELFPLSSIGIETMPNGQTVYNIFGALSAASSLTNIVTEIHTLVDNVQRASEAFADFFNHGQ